MNGSIGWYMLLQLFLIALNALFACAEIAIISMNDNRLAKLTAAGDKRAVRLTKLTGHPARFLATIQVGITLAGFLASAFAASHFADGFAGWLITVMPMPAATLHTLSVILITLILSFFTLVLGELVPKRIGMRKAESIALAMSGLVYFISKLFAPVVWLLSASTNGILRLLGIDPHAEDSAVTEEEIRMLVDEGSEKGVIDASEKEMIQNVFEFNDKIAAEVMTHRKDVALLWLDQSDEQWADIISTTSRHSLYPVCDQSSDNVLGILNTKNYFRLDDRSRDNVMEKAVRSAYFVPETVRADVLFRNMQKSRDHFAVVLDEYGGMQGIITMNDLLEEIVGELEDDNSIPVDPPLIEKIDAKSFKVQGHAPLYMVSKRVGVLLPEDEYDTFGGMVFGLLGYVPRDGSTPELESFGLSIKVTDIRTHQLKEAIVYRKTKPPADVRQS